MAQTTINTWLLIIAVIPLATGAAVSVIRAAIQKGKEEEWQRDVSRRLRRIEQRLGMWGHDDDANA